MVGVSSTQLKTHGALTFFLSRRQEKASHQPPCLFLRLQLRELQSDLKPWLPWSHHPQSGSANPQSGELSLNSNVSAHEWKEKNGRQERRNFVPYCKDVRHLTSGAHWKSSASDFPGRRRSHPGGGQRERSGWVTCSRNVLSPRPYLVLPYGCWPGVSHSTSASDWTPLPWASSSHLPSLSNKQPNTCQLPEPKAWISGPQGQGQPWSPRRGRGNRKTTKAPRQWGGH